MESPFSKKSPIQIKTSSNKAKGNAPPPIMHSPAKVIIHKQYSYAWCISES
jgi:hypothetical protein